MPASDMSVITGGGLTCAKTAEALRAQGFGGRIVLAAEEEIGPYSGHRCPSITCRGTRSATRSSCILWTGTTPIGSSLLPGTAVTGIDRSRREVTLAGGGYLAYDNLCAGHWIGPVPPAAAGTGRRQRAVPAQSGGQRPDPGRLHLTDPAVPEKGS